MASQIQKYVINTFEQSQTGATGHKTLALKLKNVYMQNRDTPQLKQFEICFSRCVDKLLSVGKKDQCADRVIEFLVEFTKLVVPADIAEDDEEGELIIQFFENLIERYLPGFDSRLAQVRLRCILLVSSLIPLIPLNEDLLVQIEDKAIERMNDIDTKVRVNAALLVARFDLTEKITSALVNAMTYDPSPEVRLVVAYNIAHGSQKLAERVCERVRDTSTQIRLAMYRKILPSIDFRTLSISSRERIVRAGLNDRDEQVRKAASLLIAQQWVSVCDNNIELVLQRLDVIGRTEIADMMLQAFFKLRRDVVEQLEFNDEFFANIWVEDTVLLRGFFEFCMKEGLEKLSEEKMPDLTTIASNIDHLWSKFEDPMLYENVETQEEAEDLRVCLPFMVDQLLDVASKYDLTDEASRQSISQVTTRIAMSDTAPTYKSMAHIVAIQRRLNSSDTALVSWAFETLEATPSMSSQATSDSDLVSGLLRGLSLFKSILAKVKSQDIVSYLPSIYTTYIHQALQSPITDISMLGLECLGLACLLDFKFASSHIKHFIQYVEKHQRVEIPEFASLVAFCIHAITDMLLHYEDPTDETDFSHEEEKLPKDKIIPLICSLLKAPASATQHAAALSLAKLTLARLVPDRSHIIRLLLVYYFSRSNTSAEDGEQNSLIQQQLLLFFKAQGLFPEGRLDIARTFTGAFNEYAKWHATHPSSVSLGDFVRQVIELTMPGQPSDSNEISEQNDNTSTNNAHPVLAISIFDLIIGTEDTTLRRSLASTLKLLQMDEATKTELRLIRELHGSILDLESIRGQTTKKEIEAFLANVNQLYEKKSDEPSEAEETHLEDSMIDFDDKDVESPDVSVPERASTPQQDNTSTADQTSEAESI